MLQIARDGRMPVILFAEGGGGRPGDTETSGDSGGTPTFGRFAELSGLAPLIGIASGRCFAGNASLLGCCDVVIATRNANIGMGGPAMVEGGGLGVFAPEEIGPFDVQLANGVIDVGVRDEAEAVRVAKAVPVLFPGTLAELRGAGSAAAAATHPRESPARVRRSTRSSRRWPTSAPCSSCGVSSRAGWSRP